MRVFDFPTPMQSHGARDESIVAPQALFTLNAPFVIEQSIALTETDAFKECSTDEERSNYLIESVFQRDAYPPETPRIIRFVEQQRRVFANSPKTQQIRSPWPLVAQAMLMSNEFQYID